MNTLDVLGFQEKILRFFSALNSGLMALLSKGRCMLWAMFICLLAGLPVKAQQPNQGSDITIRIGSGRQDTQEDRTGAIHIGRDKRSGDHVIQVVPPAEEDTSTATDIGPILVVPEVSLPHPPIQPVPPRPPR